MLRQNWNFDWTFAKENETPIKVNLPYDAMIHEARVGRLKDGGNTGYFPGGKYIYTKEFECDETMLDKDVTLEFEGVYQKSTVLLNNEKVGGHIYGFSRFYAPLTGKLKKGTNTVTVIADNTQMMNCRWYSGSGIYRDVNLYVGEKSHIALDGVRLYTKSHSPAVLGVEIETVDAEGLKLVTEVSYKGDVVATAEGNKAEIDIPDAKLWSYDTPNLYDVKVKLMDSETVVDEYVDRTGICKVAYSALTGMTVNGKETKLRGACVHHDHGPIGANSFKKAELRKAKILKKAGFNAVRAAHNPYSRAFLEACDEVGLYVLHESFDTWTSKKSDYDYGLYFNEEAENDLANMVIISRNHPSIVMYGIGNEIFETGKPEGAEISRKLVAVCKKYDPERATTNCLNPLCTGMGSMNAGLNSSDTHPDDVGNPCELAPDSSAAGSKLVNMLVTFMPVLMKVLGSPKKMMKVAKGPMEDVDVVGFNYGDYAYKPIHEMQPSWVILGSETYAPSLYSNWQQVENNKYIIGDFCWTGWDYLGETGVGLPLYGVSKGNFNKPYPCVSAGCGSVDLSGAIGAPAHYSSAVWNLTNTPYIGVRPVNHVGEKYFLGMWRATDAIENWSWYGMEGHAAEIEVFSHGATIELIQDGKSLGKKKVENCKAKFETTYTPGKLEAIAYDKFSREIGRSVLQSASKETVLTAKPEEKTIQADGMDLAYFVINIADSKGNVKLLEDKKVTVNVEGAGELIGLGSARVDTEEVFTSNTYSTHEGRMIAIVRSNGQKGEIKLTASAEGLDSVSTTVLAE